MLQVRTYPERLAGGWPKIKTYVQPIVDDTAVLGRLIRREAKSTR